jgi:prepilin-type N-terminal cleavage/methylation domain-containing protein
MHVLRSQAGFTLVEVMMAICVLLVGVLGTVALVDAADQTSGTTMAREAATNLARDLIEGIHSVAYRQLTPDGIVPVLQAQAGLADTDGSAAGWQVSRRGFVFTVTAQVCVIDDPSDGVGSHDSTFCSQQPTPTAAQSQLSDPDPADYKRATVTVSWKVGSTTSQLNQSTVVAKAYHGPTVTQVAPAGWTLPYTGLAQTLSFNVTTDTPADHVDWLLGGADQGAASGSGTAWSFAWNIGAPVGSGGGGCSLTGAGTLDGTYFVGAQGFDQNNLSPGPGALTVALNRCPPLPPAGFAGGRSVSRGDIELLWQQNKEGDVVGYHLFRSSSSSGPWTAIDGGSCSGLVKVTTCTDTDSPAANVYYKLVAVDTGPGGSSRDGALPDSQPLTVNYNVQAPYWTVANPLQSGTASTLAWPAATDPNGGPIRYYWIYRDGTDRAHRYDQVDGSTLAWTDDATGGTQHTYYVTAVDSAYAESTLSNAVTR